MKKRHVAFFCMPEPGHFQRLLPLISGLCSRGVRATVLTHRRFMRAVQEVGAEFFDLFLRYPLDEADAESVPVPARYVSFAGTFLEAVEREVVELRPSLIVYDTFAVVGGMVARRLAIPYVNLCAGHNVEPSRFLRMLAEDPRVRISPRCEAAVARLRERHGIADASPFSYVSLLSPFLNLYCEPPEFLTENERQPFEPLAFFGSLSGLEPNTLRRDAAKWPFEAPGRRPLTVYVSFGTVVWRYYAREALSALITITGALADVPAVTTIVSLGDADVSRDDLLALTQGNVQVATYVDQPRLLREADCFITHHGLNSTHEAIANRVPMVSYPFFWDQPALAQRCQVFDLAVPLTGTLRGKVERDQVLAALAALADRRVPLMAGLDRAYEWERCVIAGRGAVLERLIHLM
jgi:MGT family glycosyltransferase